MPALRHTILRFLLLLAACGCLSRPALAQLERYDALADAHGVERAADEE